MTCAICNDMGVVHGVKPDGKPDWLTVIYCRCQGSMAGKIYFQTVPSYDSPPEAKEAPGLCPADYDYPMSWDNWRAICQHNGWPDPGPNKPDKGGPTSIFALEKRLEHLEEAVLAAETPEGLTQELKGLSKDFYELRERMARMKAAAANDTKHRQ